MSKEQYLICDIQADTSTRNLKEYDVSRFVTKYVSFILASEETDDLIRCQAGDFRLYHEDEKMKESNLARASMKECERKLDEIRRIMNR